MSNSARSKKRMIPAIKHINPVVSSPIPISVRILACFKDKRGGKYSYYRPIRTFCGFMKKGWEFKNGKGSRFVAGNKKDINFECFLFFFLKNLIFPIVKFQMIDFIIIYILFYEKLG